MRDRARGQSRSGQPALFVVGPHDPHRGSARVRASRAHRNTLRPIRQVNAAASFVAYPIAEETGALTGSRPVRARPAEEAA